MPEFFSPTLYAIPFFLISLSLEWWAVKSGRANGRYETKDALTSISLGLGNLAIDTLTGVLSFAALLWVWDHRLFDIPVTWWSFVLVFIGMDLTYYWKHRFMHRLRWFWMEHVTHHSSTHYNLTTALRQPWLGPFSGLFLIGAPMAWMGFHPAFMAFAMGFNLIYQYWIHTEAIGRMPRWFEAVMNTPSHHRVHHATNPRYLDGNYAGVFIVWDKMFGTFSPELDSDPCVYGLVSNVDSHNPIYLGWHGAMEFFADCWRDGLRPDRWMRRMWRPPGWSPDGAGITSDTLKRAWVEAHPEDAGAPGLRLKQPPTAAPSPAHTTQ